MRVSVKVDTMVMHGQLTCVILWLKSKLIHLGRLKKWEIWPCESCMLKVDMEVYPFNYLRITFLIPNDLKWFRLPKLFLNSKLIYEFFWNLFPLTDTYTNYKFFLTIVSGKKYQKSSMISLTHAQKLWWLLCESMQNMCGSCRVAGQCGSTCQHFVLIWDFYAIYMPTNYWPDSQHIGPTHPIDHLYCTSIEQWWHLEGVG